MADNDENDPKAKSTPLSEEIQRTFLKERKVFFWGEVRDETCSEAINTLLYLEAKDPGKEIKFYINSPGGSVTAGMAVYDTIKLMKSPVTTIVTGMAASMGSVFLCAGKKGRRFLFPHARVLIHQPLIAGRIVAPAVDINIHAQEIERQRKEINQIIQEASGQPFEKVEKDTDRDFYMNPEEAIKYGLADAVIKPEDL
ncbi:MAG TPA: ATP-dependent Clp protease proteolytic subunit [Opitutae bacterium]|nr:ATP-dependent Clp protease proteolytic subunit [Opitutae bacterium]|tara:strand:- start:3106 stop:3699 length:594 start_codon:yes stop_codon:yes gene_type:complete